MKKALSGGDSWHGLEVGFNFVIVPGMWCEDICKMLCEVVCFFHV